MMEYSDLEERYKKYLPNHTNARAESTIKKYWEHVVVAFRWKGGDPTEWTQDDADSYRAYMKRIYNKNSESPENENTLIPHCAALKAYFRLIGLDIKLKTPRKTETNKEPLTEREMDKIEECAKDESLRDYAILKVLRETMQRVSDVCSIDINKISKKNSTIRLFIKKTQKWHTANISQNCIVAIEQYVAHEREEPKDKSKALLTTKYGKRIDRGTVWNIVRKHAARAGIKKKIYPHLYRISGITLMDERGIQPKEGMALTGHKDVRTYLGYVQTNKEKVRKAFEIGVLGNGTENNHFTRIPEINEEPENVPMLTNEMREKLLMDKLLLGEISEQTFLKLQNALVRVRDNKEIFGYG